MDETKSWSIPNLDGDNHDSWFRHYKVKLTGKGVFHVVEQPLEEVCRIGYVEDLNKNMEDLDISSKLAKTGRTNTTLNTDKKKQYLQDEAIAIDLLFRSLSVDDQALYDEYDSAYKLWTYLKKKYQQTDPTTANQYMTLIQTFKIVDLTIINAWDRLKDYRRKLCAADKEARNTYPDRALLLILIRALPREYISTIDTLDAQPDLSVGEKLKRLQTKENRLIDERQDDQALLSSYKPYKKKLSKSRAYDHAEEGDESGYTPICYLCEMRHFIKACPYMDDAKNFVQGLIQDKRLKNNGKSRITSRSNPRSSSRSTRSTSRKKVSFNNKAKAFEASIIPDSQYEMGFSDNDDNNSQQEHAQISRALISR